MNKSYYVIIILVILVLVGGLLYYTAPASNREGESRSQTRNAQVIVEEPITVPEMANVIVFKNSGYAPEALTIKIGQTVVFKNESDQPTWPASAMHPTHNGYPTTGGCIGSVFDACGEVVPGGAWSFQFDQKGSWKYHDHLNPSSKGTIVVE